MKKIKVYAARRAQSLDRFIGQDVWVKVRERNPFGFSYIRVVSKNDNSYVFNEVDVRRISRDGVCRCKQEYMDNKLKYTRTKSQYELDIVQPLDCVSTEELFEVI